MITGAKILIVDDNVNNIQVLGSVLHEEKFKVAVSKDGETALRMANEILPDIILLDIMMPGMDGYEVCRRLKADEKTKEIPVLFLTAKTELDAILKGFETGAVDYVTKPFQREELMARVSTHLKLRFSMRELQHTTDRLHQSNQLKDKLFSILGHDLRSPLTGIRLTLQLLNDEHIDRYGERFDELMDMLSQSVDRSNDLLENLLHWAKSQSGMLKTYPEDFNLASLIKDLRLLMQNNAASKKIKIEFQVEEQLMVHADKNMISTVLRNLLSNAIKFTKENGEVKLRAKNLGDKLEILVEDTGVGVSKADLPKLFDEGVHFTTYGTKNEKGTGLGLRLCKDFVEKNEGTIEVDSILGKGTKFRVMLNAAGHELG